MTTWGTLFPEIHHIIFSLFCKNIIAEYTQFDPDKLHDDYLGPFSWPRPPPSLLAFSAALRVNRAFHDSILGFKFNGESIALILRSLQAERVKQILRAESRSGRLNRCGYLDLGILMKWAGVFWRNPLLRNDVELMSVILDALRPAGSILLIPHLEEWILAHSIPVFTEGTITCDVDANLGGKGRSCMLSAAFEIGRWRGRTGRASTEVRSVKGLYQGTNLDESFLSSSDIDLNDTTVEFQRRLNDELILNCPVFEEFENNSGEWWLFTLDDAWIIVDYRRKRIWGNMCQQKMCYWDDVWEVKTWKLGPDKRAFQEDWVIKDYDSGGGGLGWAWNH
jgi:hypothetical protein